jgi:hypothetical protein
MRARLMAYSRGMPDAKRLREKFAHVSTLLEIEAIAKENIFPEKSDRPKAETPALVC